MPWVFFSDRPTQEHVMDVRAVNEWVAEAADFLAAPGWTEHAFAEGLYDTATNVLAPVFRRVWVNTYKVDPAVDAAAISLPLVSQWAAVSPTQYRAVVTTDTGTLEIHASFIVRNPNTLGPPPSNPPGIVFAIEIDGAIRYECATGGADPSGDLIENGFNVVVGGGGSPGVVNNGYGPGIRAEYTPVRVETAAVVGAGEHVIRLMYRNVEPARNDALQYVSNGEMTVVWSAT